MSLDFFQKLKSKKIKHGKTERFTSRPASPYACRALEEFVPFKGLCQDFVMGK